MDDTMIQLLEKLFYKKIILYNDLLHCFNKERESLVNIDLDNLWAVSKEKEEICSKIECVRQEMVSATNQPGMKAEALSVKHILELVPREDRARFQELYHTLNNIKCEVDIFRKENMAFIDDSLHFLDEMISIITEDTKSKTTTMYNDRCHLRKSRAPLLLSREA